MRIGIISEYNSDYVNYGNSLQAFSLNYVINTRYGEAEAISLELSAEACEWTRTSVIGALVTKVKKLFGKQTAVDCTPSAKIANRHKVFKVFRDSIKTAAPIMTHSDLESLHFDTFIVGSDVVWAQVPNYISRSKFLDFSLPNAFEKVSYAASFGTDYIPESNLKDVTKYLLDFDYISVREQSSVSFLKSVGIPNAVHVLDPTLLLDKQDWELLEARPQKLPEEYLLKGYVFAYLLESSNKVKEELHSWCKQQGLMLAMVPEANGKQNDADYINCDLALDDIDPFEWVYLINHASFVFTDSFHGIALSCDLETNFFVVNRKHLNNRIEDFLGLTNQSNKKMSDHILHNLDKVDWEWDKTRSTLHGLREASFNYLDKALGYQNND